MSGRGSAAGRLLARPVRIDKAQTHTLEAGFGGTSYPPPEAVGFTDPTQCVYWAYLKRPDIYVTSVNAARAQGVDIRFNWYAYEWADNAARYGHIAEGSVPLGGAIMVQPRNPADAGSVGHVAYVDHVIDSGHFVTTERNTYGHNNDTTTYTVINDFAASSSHAAFRGSDGQLHRHIGPGTLFIYGGPVISPPQYAGYLGHIVHWAAEQKAQKTAWLVVDVGGRLQREWIRDIPTYWCLKNSGVPGPDELSSSVLDAMPDNGQKVNCAGSSNLPGGAGAGGGGGGGLPASGEATWTELEGHHGVNTFTDPMHAGGQGQSIASGQQVQVSRRVYAPQVASVNPDGWWYRIASSPWNDQYYAPANTFMNGDPWNGPYTHNTDFAVTVCADSSSPGQPTTTTTPTTTTPAPPSATTWGETVGGNANTWTNYTNAGGTQGPTIPAYTTVQIACKVQGFRVADGNTWWYRIASAAWNNEFYVSADAFYNNGQTSGSLLGTPFLDPNVPDC